MEIGTLHVRLLILEMHLVDTTPPQPLIGVVSLRITHLRLEGLTIVVILLRKQFTERGNFWALDTVGYAP